MDGETDMTKLIVAFRKFAKAPKTTHKILAGKSEEKKNWREIKVNGKIRNYNKT